MYIAVLYLQYRVRPHNRTTCGRGRTRSCSEDPWRCSHVDDPRGATAPTFRRPSGLSSSVVERRILVGASAPGIAGQNGPSLCIWGRFFIHSLISSPTAFRRHALRTAMTRRGAGMNGVAAPDGARWPTVDHLGSFETR